MRMRFILVRGVSPSLFPFHALHFDEWIWLITMTLSIVVAFHLSIHPPLSLSLCFSWLLLLFSRTPPLCWRGLRPYFHLRSPGRECVTVSESPPESRMKRERWCVSGTVVSCRRRPLMKKWKRKYMLDRRGCCTSRSCVILQFFCLNLLRLVWLNPSTLQ